MFKHILIPTDGSRLSHRAVQQGIELAKEQGAAVTAVTVSEPFHMLAVEPFAATENDDTYRAECEKRASRHLDAIRKLGVQHGIEVAGTHVYAEQPFAAIIDTAVRVGCDLICMASHGRRGMSALLLGSETVKVLTHSKIPVLVSR
jgi:nucleotide-binding universal stress UspA family protein